MYSAFKLCLFLAVVAVSAAEPPSAYRGWYSHPDSGPYQPSGWRPSGPDFRLPVPQALYGSPPQGYLPVPAQEYGPPPPQEYGPPSTETPTTTEQEMTTTEEFTTTEAATTTEAYTEAESANSVDGEEQSQKLVQPVDQQGIYFIYHPSGLLQRVDYSTREDTAKMAYSANFKYENVEPISGPIYTYDPMTFVFKRLN
ncbi:unnamed protein product [Phaedon cochleariae]|uniref:Uncharacterized protein n=1 Tax=Phaedon cochleariae TaxID=80249 RepID=A0A9P0DWQ4_PHACE|nr:unnamed protein product [Phaedon cochleariae]